MNVYGYVANNDGTSTTASVSSTSFDTGTNTVNTFMILGRIDWVANGGNDTLTLWNITDPTAALGSSFATMTADLDQSAFDTLAITDRQVGTFDEIRFGATLADVMPTATDAPPGIDTLVPAHTASGVNPAANVSITFNEDIAFGTGNITLRQSGGALVESFDVSIPASGLSLAGNTVTINPTSDLAFETTYYVEIDSTAIEDLVGNSFVGISGDGTWSFTTTVQDTTVPDIAILSPVNGASGVSVGSNLTITFTEDVAFGTGNITLYQSGGTLIESFDVSVPAAGLSLAGDTVTINPVSNLSFVTTYYVEIADTAIDDLAGNSYTGFTGDGTWSFTSSDDSSTIYEPFDYPLGTINGTQGGAAGTIGNWTQTQQGGGTGQFNIVSGLAFEGLSTTGGAVKRTSANGGSEISIPVSPFAKTALLTDGTSTYFSLLIRADVFSNGRENTAFVIGTGAFDDNDQDFVLPTITGGEGFGVNFGNGTDTAGGQQISGFAIDDGAAAESAGVISTSNGATYMIVGRIDWAANGSNDTLTLWNIPEPGVGGTPVLPGASFATMTADLDQAAFGTLAIADRQVGTIDEIRFGSTLADVGAAPGTGTVTFSDWQTANGTVGGADEDHDGDGVSNGVEFFLGGPNDTTGFTALPGVDNTGGILSITWTKHPDYPGSYGIGYVVETSTTLLPGSWIPAAPGDISGVVTYTFPAPLGTKNFVRLKVTGP